MILRKGIVAMIRPSFLPVQQPDAPRTNDLGRPVQGNVKGNGRMRQRAGADAIDACFRNRAHSAQRHAALGFQLNCWCQGVPQRDRLAQLVHTHVIQQHDIRPLVQNSLQLAERIYLDLQDHLSARIIDRKILG